MSQQCGMEPSHSPPWGPMLVSHYKLLNMSLAESQCPSCSILVGTRTRVLRTKFIIRDQTDSCANHIARKSSRHDHSDPCANPSPPNRT